VKKDRLRDLPSRPNISIAILNRRDPTVIDKVKMAMNATALDAAVRTPTGSCETRGGFTTARAQKLLRSIYAPWVQDLNLIVEDCSSNGVRLRLPYSPRFVRFGNTICGQTLMACADSAIPIAIWAAFGDFTNVTTVSQAISFMRPIANRDVLVNATVRKLGRNLVFGDAFFTASDADTVCAHAIATWALIP
jgi:acyl-coenzyme A thioesterase PaaI-like protein